MTVVQEREAGLRHGAIGMFDALHAETLAELRAQRLERHRVKAAALAHRERCVEDHALVQASAGAPSGSSRAGTPGVVGQHVPIIHSHCY